MREQAIRNIKAIWGYRCESWTKEEWQPLIELEIEIISFRKSKST